MRSSLGSVSLLHDICELLYTMANEIETNSLQGGLTASSIIPGAWHANEQKIVTNVISIQQTKEAMDKVRASFPSQVK